MESQSKSIGETNKGQEDRGRARASVHHQPDSQSGIGFLRVQETAGNLAVQRMFQSGLVQAKLAVSQPGDPGEEEADRVADDFMRMPESSVHQECSGCAAGDCPKCHEERIQRKAEPNHSPEVSPDVSSKITSLGGASEPLPASMRALFEPRFGRDFSGVRLHTDGAAAESARAIQARAFTIGPNVVFGAAEYAPEDSEGRKLLAHELTHVVQQEGASSPGTVQRQSASAGMTSADAPASVPASVPASTPEPTASMPTAADTQNRTLINNAIKSSDPADVKKIKNFAAASQTEKFDLIKILLNQGWVGPYDEWALEAIWGSFGDGVVALTPASFKLWNDCIERGAELGDLPAAAKLRVRFESDIRAVVSGYLAQNRQLVMDEIGRLGLPPDERSEAPPPTAHQVDEIQEMQAVASVIAELQKAQEMVRGNVLVGYEPAGHSPQLDLVQGDQPSPPSFAAPMFNPVFFDPFHKPTLDHDPQSGLIMGASPSRVTPYETVKEKYDQAGAKIEEWLSGYPALYAISRQGKSVDTEAFSAEANPAAARRQLGVAMRKLFHDIEETQIKLDGGGLNPLDLTPIYDQLLGGLKAPSGIDWKLPLPESLAREMVKDHQFANALKTLGLETAAAALFMLAPLTGGASIYVMLAGLAVTGVKLYLSTEQYETLAQAAKTSPKPGTELVAKAQVDEAKMVMEADRIAFALAILAVGTEVAARSFSAVKDFRTKLELRSGAIDIRSRYLGKPFPKGNVATAKIELEDGTQMGFGETSRQKSPLVKEPPVPKSEGGQFEPRADPNKQGAPIADTDPEYKILSSAADALEKQHGVNVKGKLYLYSERELCVSCNDVLGQFQKKFPNIKTKVFHDYPYPQAQGTPKP